MWCTIRRQAVVIEDLERAVNISYSLQEILQLLHRHLYNFIIFSVVEPTRCKRRELGALGVRSIVVIIRAAVG